MITVVIPAYKAAEHIGRCLRSVERQARMPDEIVIVVDGCRETLEAVKTGTPENLRPITRVLWLPKNTGAVGRVYNLGMTYARGDVLVCFDADDEMLPHYVQSMAAIVEAGKVALARQKVMRGDEIEKSHFVSTGMTMGRAAFLQAGGHPDWPCEEDMELRQRLEWMGYETQAPKEENMIRHKEPGSITESDGAGFGSETQRKYRSKREGRKKEPVVRNEIAIAPLFEVEALWD